MIDAYLRKGIRTLFSSKIEDVNRGRNEDAVTSMTFSPLYLMRPLDCVQCLSILLEKPFDARVRGRTPIECVVELWPAKLKYLNDGEFRRCEPDVLTRLVFEDGRSLLVIVEVKWNWLPTALMIDGQLERQRIAALSDERFSSDDTLVCTLTQHRLPGQPNNGMRLTWTEAHDRLVRSRANSPAGRWAKMTAQFLERARQISFQGMDRWNYIDLVPVETQFFFEEHFDWCGTYIQAPISSSVFFEEMS